MDDEQSLIEATGFYQQRNGGKAHVRYIDTERGVAYGVTACGRDELWGTLRGEIGCLAHDDKDIIRLWVEPKATDAWIEACSASAGDHLPSEADQRNAIVPCPGYYRQHDGGKAEVVGVGRGWAFGFDGRGRKTKWASTTGFMDGFVNHCDEHIAGHWEDSPCPKCRKCRQPLLFSARQTGSGRLCHSCGYASSLAEIKRLCELAEHLNADAARYRFIRMPSIDGKWPAETTLFKPFIQNGRVMGCDLKEAEELDLEVDKAMGAHQ